MPSSASSSDSPETPHRPDAEAEPPAVPETPAGDEAAPKRPNGKAEHAEAVVPAADPAGAEAPTVAPESGGPEADAPEEDALEGEASEDEVPTLRAPDSVPEGLVVIEVSDGPEDPDAPPASGDAPPARDAWTPAPAPEAPPRRRWLKYWPIPALLLAVLVAVWVWPEPEVPPTEEEIAQQLVVDRNAHTRSLQASPVGLRLGALATGELEVNDGYGPGGRYEDYYAVEVADSVAFEVLLTSEAFGPDLEVVTPSGERLAATNLLRTDLRAVVSGLQGPGRFVVTVTSTGPDERGAYELSATPVEEMEPLDEFEEAIQDTLGGGALRAGRYSRRFALLFDPEKPALIRVTAEAFQPRVYVLGPEGEIEAYWRTVEYVEMDSLRQTVFRFEPGWELPYTLLVTSEEAGARGAFTVEVLEAEPVRIPTNGRFVAANLGELSWLEEGRYLDRYLFRASARDTVEVTVRRSEEFVPTIRVFRGDRAASELIGSGSSVTAQFVADASAEYLLEVSSEEEAMRGPYQVSVEVVDAPPPPRSDDDDDRPAPSGRPGPEPQQNSGFRSSQTGTTVRGYRFQVTVTAVDVRWVDGRIRVAVGIAERSVDFTGGWDVWWRRVARSYLTDNAGRQYSPSLPETRGGRADQARPGSVRAGSAVYYAPASDANATSLTLHYPIGGDGQRMLQIPIPIRR